MVVLVSCEGRDEEEEEEEEEGTRGETVKDVDEAQR